MSLYDDVLARIPEQTLIELTNPRSNNAQAIDTTLLTLVCGDVQAELEIELGVGYRASTLLERDQNFHVVKGVEGVMLKLATYTSTDATSAQRRYEKWQDSILRRRKRATMNPRTNAKAEVTDDKDTDRPDFDKSTAVQGWLPRTAGNVGETMQLPQDD